MKPHRFSRLWFTMKKKENHDYTLFDFLQFQREEKQKSISRNAGSRERIYSIPPIRISATGIFVILGVISIYEFIISNQICIVFTIFRLIWKQTEFRLVINRLNKIPKGFKEVTLLKTSKKKFLMRKTLKCNLSWIRSSLRTSGANEQSQEMRELVSHV